MTVFPIVNRCRRFAALQDEQMVRHRAYFSTSKGAHRAGNLSLRCREKIPNRRHAGYAAHGGDGGFSVANITLQDQLGGALDGNDTDTCSRREVRRNNERACAFAGPQFPGPFRRARKPRAGS
jgi:hypothetical protein